MRSGPNSRRPMRRGGGNSGSGGNSGRRGGSPRSQSFESNGPDVKVRGNAQQIVDKYQALAREASTAGNPVMAENYYQHAEHYFRVLSASGGGGEGRYNNRQASGDGGHGHHKAGNDQQLSNGQSDGQPAVRTNGHTAEEEATTEFVPPSETNTLPEVAGAPEETTLPEIAAMSEEKAPADTSSSEPGAEKVRKGQRKRPSRSSKSVKSDDAAISVMPAEATPASSEILPSAEGTE